MVLLVCFPQHTMMRQSYAASPHKGLEGSFMRNFNRLALACVLAVLVASCGGSITGAAWDVDALWDRSNWE